MVSANPIARLIAAVALVSAAGASSVALQQRNPPSAVRQPSPDQAAAAAKVKIQPGAGWSSKCESQSRQAAVECYVEQTVVLTGSGRLLVSVSIRVPANTHQPLMIIQVPLGLYLPAGLGLQIDNDKLPSLAIETCDLKGCFAGTSVSKQMLGAMQTGKLFKITLQSVSKEKIEVPLPLTNFAQAYKNIE
jgi:invasion protein IalB